MRKPYIRRYSAGYNLVWAIVKLAESIVEAATLGQVDLGWTTELAQWKAKKDMRIMKAKLAEAK